MGVFSASISESYGYDIPELNINDVNAGALASDNFAEMAILGSVEVTAVHKSLVESLAAQEISAVEEGYEVVYEASSISSVVDKIKALIQKAIEKIKSLFEKVIAVFKSWTSTDKAFMKKYQTTFTKNWIKLKKLDMKVFKYNDIVQKTFTGQPEAGAKLATDLIGAIETFQLGQNASLTFKKILDKSFDKDSDVNGENALKALTDAKADEDKKDISSESEKLRGGVLAAIKKVSEGGTTSSFATDYNSSTNSYSAKEFSDELYDWYRNGDNTKDEMDKSDLEKSGYSSEKLIFVLNNGEKASQNLGKYFTKLVKGFNDKIKEQNKAVSDTKYNDSDADVNKFNTLKTWALVQYSSRLSSILECIQTWKGQYLQACKEYSRTCKSIVTKVVTMGEKRLAQEESWDYGYDNDYSNGFMNSVIIK